MVLLWTAIHFGCAPGEAGGPPFAVDLLPPTLLGMEAVDERTIRFHFDETVLAEPADLRLEPDLPLAGLSVDEEVLELRFAVDQEIGTAYVLRMEVDDQVGNTLSFLCEFTGWNPRIPDLVINEINPRGSSTTPDCVELRALSSGNLGGVVLTIGTENEYSERLVFPAVDIPEGEFIIAHAKAEGLPEEVDEIGALDVSGGRLAHDAARDFWFPGSPGLPGNNGAVTLEARRNGPVLDAVIWSDREDDPEDPRWGWTADGYDFAVDLADAGAWDAGDDGVIGPSDAVDVSDSTATRSLCRSSDSFDGDAAADWHTVPTSSQTFGGVNSDEVHEP